MKSIRFELTIQNPSGTPVWMDVKQTVSFCLESARRIGGIVGDSCSLVVRFKNPKKSDFIKIHLYRNNFGGWSLENSKYSYLGDDLTIRTQEFLDEMFPDPESVDVWVKFEKA
jgi:hypothetical protein